MAGTSSLRCNYIQCITQAWHVFTHSLHSLQSEESKAVFLMVSFEFLKVQTWEVAIPGLGYFIFSVLFFTCFFSSKWILSTSTGKALPCDMLGVLTPVFPSAFYVWSIFFSAFLMFKDITEPLGGKSASLYNKNMLQEFKQKKQNKQTITTILFQRNTF